MEPGVSEPSPIGPLLPSSVSTLRLSPPFLCSRDNPLGGLIVVETDVEG